MIRLLSAIMLLVSVAHARPGAVQVYVFDGTKGGPLAHATVAMAASRTSTNADGAAQLRPGNGNHALTVSAAGFQPGELLDVSVQEEILTEVLVTLNGARPALFDVETRALPEGLAEPVVGAGEAALGPPAELRGKIVSESNGKPVAGARIFVRGRSETASSDAQGAFTLILPSAAHQLSVIHANFSPGAAQIDLPPEGAKLSLTLAPASVLLDDMTVTAPYIEGGVAALNAERRATSAVVDVMGAEEMARSGDSDAAGALRRVTGLTVVGGKYIYVRGMGERYSSTLLNGVTLPSPEPERRVVPLDLFPTGILGSVVVQKTYSPDMPGDFGGGIVQLRTRQVTDEPFFQLNLTGGFRPDTTFQSGLGYRGGSLDFLGMDDGTRALPDAVRRASAEQILLERTRFSSAGFTADELERLGELMPNHWNLESREAPPDFGISASGGTRFTVGGVKLGGLANVAWSQQWQRFDFDRSYYIVGQGEQLELQHTYRFRSLQRNVGLTGAVELGIELPGGHEIVSTTMMLRSTDDEARQIEGRNRDVATDIRVTRLRFIERMLISEILRGEHPVGPLTLGWHYAASVADRKEPDRRTYRYDLEPVSKVWRISDRPEGNQRLYSDLDDTNHDLALRLRMPFGAAVDDPEAPAQYVELGGQAIFRDRGVDTRRYKFQDRGPRAGDVELTARNPEEIFVPENIGNGAFQFQETTRQTDNYAADQRLFAGYVMGEMPWASLRLMAGLRVEAFRQTVSTFELFNPDGAPVNAELDDVDLLPAASITWGINDTMQTRAGYSRTVSRPDFREMSPATFNDVTGGRQIFGNPELERATIQHVDVRWEWYPTARERLSIAGFYKAFDRPIEQIIIPSAQFSVTFDNAVAATNAGLEIDGRMGLLDDFYAAGNVALIRSRVELSDAGIQTSRERPLQGQSPFMINAQVGWEPEDGPLRVSLLYNVFGARIVEVGAQGAPDTLEQPQHLIDLVGAAELGAGFTLSLKAKNLLGADSKFTQGSVVQEERALGRSFSIGLRWAPDLGE